MVTAGDAVYIQGIASIRGWASHPFRVTIRDGGVTGSPDYLLLEVCACSTFGETGPIIYPDFDEVGGQIQNPTLGSAGSVTGGHAHDRMAQVHPNVH